MVAGLQAVLLLSSVCQIHQVLLCLKKEPALCISLSAAGLDTNADQQALQASAAPLQSHCLACGSAASWADCRSSCRSWTRMLSTSHACLVPGALPDKQSLASELRDQGFCTDQARAGVPHHTSRAQIQSTRITGGLARACLEHFTPKLGQWASPYKQSPASRRRESRAPRPAILTSELSSSFPVSFSASSEATEISKPSSPVYLPWPPG